MKGSIGGLKLIAIIIFSSAVVVAVVFGLLVINVYK